MASKKLLVTLTNSGDEAAARASGANVLAQYPHALLVQCATDEQENKIKEAGLEAAELQPPQVQLSGTSFAFAAAEAAERAQPVKLRSPTRRAYYLVQLIGPAKGEWLDEIRAMGGAVHGSMPSFTLIVGMEPGKVDALRAKPYVEAVTPYRPAMKLSPELRRSRARVLGATELSAAVEPADAATPQEGHQVQVRVFPGESTTGVASLVRAAGGNVMSETLDTVVAVVPSDGITKLADEQGVQSILPHRFPKFFNDRALGVMGVPPDGVVGETSLDGDGQIVAIADSGLDTGDRDTIHGDFRGRIAGILSFPLPPGLIPLSHEQAGFNDGPADKGEGHGTHVTGSVLGNGSVARARGSNIVPQGAAPKARIFFQAVEQGVRWKSRAELLAQGQLPPPQWPLPKFGLYALPDTLAQLFQPAYNAGARLHSNSWGAQGEEMFGQYDQQASDVDSFLFNHRDMLILFAAGNDGADRDHDAMIDSGSVTPPGTAKNCLTVGASENNRSAPNLRPGDPWDRQWSEIGTAWTTMARAGAVADNPQGMACFSSRGPTEDGRLKPDVVAPGTSILSVRSSAVPTADPLWGDVPEAHPLHRLYCWSGGTSMSTPLVAGLAALIRQYLVKDRHHVEPGSKPSGALIKGLLINGAAELAGHFAGEIPTESGANSVSGFGLVNLRQTIIPGGTDVQFDDEPGHALASGEMRVFEARAADTAQPLRVTLVWTDAPSLPANGSLENKLYLQVRTPDGTVLQGDVTNFPIATNNVQRVIVRNPVAGAYQIRVRGIDVTRSAPSAPPGPPRQDFALIAGNATSLTSS
jgi:serine protease AprX